MSDYKTLAEVERAYILGMLRQLNGNRTNTAKVLKISIRTLRNKIRLYLSQGFHVTAYGGWCE